MGCGCNKAKRSLGAVEPRVGMVTRYEVWARGQLLGVRGTVGEAEVLAEGERGARVRSVSVAPGRSHA